MKDAPAAAAIPDDVQIKLRIVMTQAELDRRFDLHRPRSADDGLACDEIRAGAKWLAELIAKKTPVNREQAQALSALELTLFHAIAAIVRP